MKQRLLYSVRKLLSSILSRLFKVSLIISDASLLREKLPVFSEIEPAISFSSFGRFPGKQFTPIPIIRLSICPVSKLV